jgi:hypothetical protein
MSVFFLLVVRIGGCGSDACGADEQARAESRRAMIGRRLRQRFPGSGRARAIPCKFSGSACDCDRLRCAEPMHREGVRINRAPDAKQADTIVIGDGDRGGTGCDEIRDGGFRIRRSYGRAPPVISHHRHVQKSARKVPGCIRPASAVVDWNTLCARSSLGRSGARNGTVQTTHQRERDQFRKTEL